MYTEKNWLKGNKLILSGAGEDEIYMQSLWYFDLLQFLNDLETPRQSRNIKTTRHKTKTDQSSTSSL